MPDGTSALEDISASAKALNRTVQTLPSFKRIRRIQHALALVLALTLVAGGLAGVAVWRQSRTAHCMVSWANALQTRSSALNGPAKDRSDASAKVTRALGNVTAILAARAGVKTPPTPELLAAYYKAIRDLDVAERAFTDADNAYNEAFKANPAGPVADKLRCA